MSYKSYKGKWQVGGSSPTITLLASGLFCFNKVCYETFVKSRNNRDSAHASPACKYVRLYYDPEFKKIAFELLTERTGEMAFPISLTKTGLLAVVNGKVFLKHFGIKYEGQTRSYPVHQSYITDSGPGYKRSWSKSKKPVIEIRLDEYIAE